MGFIGGALGVRLLRSIGRNGRTAHLDGSAYAHRSKLEALLGPGIWREIEDKVVLDFGCGAGAEAVEMARRGARRVIGLDIRDDLLRAAREHAARAGVADRCTFTTRAVGPVDRITAVDSFEHFDDPAAVLASMHGLLGPGGCVRVSFGPTWYHPLGGHLFSVFPWAHLVFTEKALIRWRSDFKSDGATRFREVEGGLNGMTIRRFESLIDQSPLRFAAFEAIPIRKLRALAGRPTREFTTACVRCTLVARREPVQSPAAGA